MREAFYIVHKSGTEQISWVFLCFITAIFCSPKHDTNESDNWESCGWGEINMTGKMAKWNTEQASFMTVKISHNSTVAAT
jgi:hypothetical protein